MWPSHAVKCGLSAAQRIQALISECSFSTQGRGYWGYTRHMAALCRVLLLRCFSDLVTALYYTAGCSGNRLRGLQKQLEHNNQETIFDISIWSAFTLLCEGLYFAFSQCRSSSDFKLSLIRALPPQNPLWTWNTVNHHSFPLSSRHSWHLWLDTHFFDMLGCVWCVQTVLVIHFPAIKRQHKAISQYNRFVSSPSRSPGGPITGPSGPWRWFREKRGGKNKVWRETVNSLVDKGGLPLCY